MEKGHRRGFTLVEVMIVMLLFSMLLLMIFPMRRMAVWVLDHARTQEQAEMLGPRWKVWVMGSGFPYYWNEVIGKTVFLTREEAEAALRREKE